MNGNPTIGLVKCPISKLRVHVGNKPKFKSPGVDDPSVTFWGTPPHGGLRQNGIPYAQYTFFVVGQKEVFTLKNRSACPKKKCLKRRGYMRRNVQIDPGEQSDILWEWMPANEILRIPTWSLRKKAVEKSSVMFGGLRNSGLWGQTFWDPPNTPRGREVFGREARKTKVQGSLQTYFHGCTCLIWRWLKWFFHEFYKRFDLVTQKSFKQSCSEAFSKNPPHIF